MEDLDIWRTATLLISQHGEKVVFEAASRAEGLSPRMISRALPYWSRIGRAFEELERHKPREGEAMN
jgi:hypothetical protein